MNTELIGKDTPGIGILICGHGSRSELALLEFSRLVEALRSRLPNIPIEFGFLEFARPILTEALDRLRSQSITKVIAVPAMLFAAGHAKNDIPIVLNAYSAKTGLEIDYGRELGVDRLMISAAGERIKEAISNQSFLPYSETLLLVVGRGSSDPDANSNVSKITRMLVEGLGFGWGETVFSGVTFPLVKPGLEHVVKLGYKRIIVFPYFLFSGILMDRIHKHTSKVANDFPSIEFISASYLGAHPLVVETFIERINETIKGINNMNCSLCKYRSSVLGFENEVGLIQESHHHHVEGIQPSSVRKKIIDSLKKNNNINTNDSKFSKKSHTHTHEHYPYPQADHPLGPSTLSEESEIKSKEN